MSEELGVFYILIMLFASFMLMWCMTEDDEDEDED